MLNAAAVAAVLVPAVAVCTREGGSGQAAEEAGREPVVAFDTSALRIETSTDTFHLTVEVASTPDQRGYGLMERAELAEDAGMLFLFEEPQDSSAGFWMYRTLIPLDIAFLGADGRIVAIREMKPCGSPNPQVCRTYAPGVPYASALEVNAGCFERRGIEVGDRVVLPSRL